MKYVEKYTKVIRLTDDERKKLVNFMKNEYGAEDVVQFKVYLDNHTVVCEIESLLRDENGKFVIGGNE